MYRLLVVCFLCLVAIRGWSQMNPFKEIQNDLDQLRSISDVNKKRFEIEKIGQQIQDYFAFDEGAWAHLVKCNQIAAACSKDSLVQVVSFYAFTYPDVIQYEWFVKVNVPSINTVYHFSDELTGDVTKAKILPRLEIKLEQILRNQNPFYKLTLHTLNKSDELLFCDDLRTKCLFEDLVKASNDSEKEAINTNIQERLNQLWLDESVFESDFKQLKRMKTLFSENKKVKVCTYNVQFDGFKQAFYGAVITPGENNVAKVYSLIDQTEKVRSPGRATLSNEKWYGAVYIDMVENTVRDRTYYTLIGYKGHDEFVKTRVLDVMYFQNKRLRFGAPIFKNDRISRHRMIYQYAAGATMMMRYDRKLKLIVMDNLAPAQSFYRGVYRYYGPDFSYNAYRFKKGIWELQQDIDLRNPKGVNAPLNNH